MRPPQDDMESAIKQYVQSISGSHEDQYTEINGIICDAFSAGYSSGWRSAMRESHKLLSLGARYLAYQAIDDGDSESGDRVK